MGTFISIVNITEQEERSLYLIDNERSYRSLFESNPQPMWIYDMETLGFLAVNDAAINQYGYSRREFLEMTIKDIRPAEDVEDLLNYTKGELNKYNPSGTWQHLRRNGQIIDVEIFSHSIIYKGKKARHVLANDITEQKKVLEELRESEAQFRLLFENMSQGVVYQDTHGKITAANESAQEMVGLTLSQMQGRSSLDPRWRAIREDGRDFPGEEHPAMIALNTGKAVPKLTMGVYHPLDERYRWINISSTPIYEKGPGKIKGVFSIFDDITNEREAEMAKRESEVLFKSIFNNLHSYATILDANGKILDINATARNDFNLSLADVQGKYVYELYWWQSKTEDFSANIKKTVELAAQGVAARQELKLRDADGNDIYFDISIKPLKDHEGKVTKLIQEGWNITEIKNQEATARILKRMYETSNSGLLILDASNSEMTITDINQAFTHITGYASEEVIGKGCDILQGDLSSKRVILKIKKSIAAEQECLVEIVNYRKSGEYFWSSMYFTPVHNDEGDLSHYVVILNDISERKRQQEELEDYRKNLERQVAQRTRELQLSQEKLLITQQLAQLGSWEYYPEEDRTEWSKETYMIFERDPAKGPYNPENILNSVVAEQRDEVKQKVECTLKEKKPAIEGVFKHITDKGNIRYLKNSSQVLFNENKQAYFIGSIIDVTEETLNQLKLDEAVKAAETANKAKSTFLANMSHEIRTPLNAIIGFSELLYRTLKDERSRAQVESIKKAGKNLLTIINEILDISKVEAGKIAVKNTPVDISKILGDVVDMFRQEANKKGLKLFFTIEDDLNCALLLDEVRLHQVLINLVGNAIKFTERGEVVISVYQQEINDHVDLKIKIKDTGIGIAESQLDVIFEPFIQHEGQAQKSYGGTGLGLAISKKFVELMGGKIILSSVPNKGSEFAIHFGRVKKGILFAAPQKSKHTEIPEIDLKGKVILVVDDVVDNRKLLCDAIQPLGARLLACSNGLEALQMAKREKPDLILMDIHMPKMNGSEAAAKLKADSDLAKVPCIAVSASSKLKNFGWHTPDNFDDYLLKPIVLEQLYDLLYKFCVNPEHEGQDQPKQSQVSGSNKEAWPKELKVHVKERMLPIYRQVMKKQLVHEMEDFGKELMELGETFNERTLWRLGSEICGHADLFDVGQLLLKMQEFELITSGKFK